VTLPARHDKMDGLVETMMTAYGPDGNDMQIADDLPKAKTLFRELVS